MYEFCAARVGWKWALIWTAAAITVSHGSASIASQTSAGWPIKDVYLLVRTDKLEYRAGEAIPLDMSVHNATQRQFIAVDALFAHNWNVWLTVLDEQGKEVEYPGWDMGGRIATADSPNDFVRINPKRFYGQMDVFRLVLKQPGRYRVRVDLLPCRSNEEVEGLKIEGYLSKELRAQSFELSIVP